MMGRMPDLPAGTLTLLFSDVDGSTGLVKRLQERYGAALEQHRRLLRAAFAEHGGTEVDTQGDSFLVLSSPSREDLHARTRRPGAALALDGGNLR
jgi:class 3 adenylate cyclase